MDTMDCSAMTCQSGCDSYYDLCTSTDGCYWDIDSFLCNSADGANSVDCCLSGYSTTSSSETTETTKSGSETTSTTSLLEPRRSTLSPTAEPSDVPTDQPTFEAETTSSTVASTAVESETTSSTVIGANI